MEAVVQVNCPKCHSVLPYEVLVSSSASELFPCPACRAPVYAKVYPRLVSGGISGKEVGKRGASEEGDAVCSFYPELKAETVCEECGCLLSEKASVIWSGNNFCMPCLHLLREKKEKDGFLSKRTIYDNLALGLVLFLAPLSLFTAPMALYYLIRYRNSSRGIVPRGKARWVLALILCVGVMLVWLILLVLWLSAVTDSI